MPIFGKPRDNGFGFTKKLTPLDLCKTVLKQCNSHETIVKSLISTFRDLYNIHLFLSVHINTRSYNIFAANPIIEFLKVVYIISSA